jgi:glycosyltransferase involved in cell wall biosynthesis
MQWPRISVITACYNSREYIEETIKSVLGQTYPNIEYIIVDGASTDGTLDIIEKYRDRIHVIISEPDRGLYDAFNKGIQASSGDIIQFLNSDDFYCHHTIVEEVAAEFKNNPGVTMVHGNIKEFDEQDDFYCFKGKQTTLEDLRNGIMLLHPTFFAARSLFDKHSPFLLKYRIAADFDFVLRCFKSDGDSVRYIDKTMVNFRLNGLSSNPLSVHETCQEMRDIILDHFGEVPLSVEARAVQSETEQINAYYKLWLEVNLLHDKGITNHLHKLGISRVAIFGTMKPSLYMYRDLLKEGFEVAVFLDNNIRMHGMEIKGVRVSSPDWLKTNQVDAIIITVEKSYGGVLHEQLQDLTKGLVPIFSWKQLIEMEYLNRRTWLTQVINP